MSSEFSRCYHFRDGSAILVISYVNNIESAKKAMLKMYGKSEFDVTFWDSGNKGPHQIFDGRNYN